MKKLDTSTELCDGGKWNILLLGNWYKEKTDIWVTRTGHYYTKCVSILDTLMAYDTGFGRFISI